AAAQHGARLPHREPDAEPPQHGGEGARRARRDGHLTRGFTKVRGASSPPRGLSVRVPLMDPKSQLDPARERVLAAITGVVESTRFILGPKVEEAEQVLSAYVGAPHGIGVGNGTDALVIALRALGVERGDEVICPSFTFYATAEAIANVGATPVFA